MVCCLRDEGTTPQFAELGNYLANFCRLLKIAGEDTLGFPLAIEFDRRFRERLQHELQSRQLQPTGVGVRMVGGGGSGGASGVAGWCV